MSKRSRAEKENEASIIDSDNGVELSGAKKTKLHNIIKGMSFNSEMIITLEHKT